MNIEKNYQEFKDLLLSTQRPGIERFVEYLDKTDLKTAPASTKYHDSFEGGLVYHSLTVYNNFISLISSESHMITYHCNFSFR